MSFLPLLGHKEGILPAGQLPNPGGTAGELVLVLPASLQKSQRMRMGPLELSEEQSWLHLFTVLLPNLPFPGICVQMVIMYHQLLFQVGRNGEFGLYRMEVKQTLCSFREKSVLSHFKKWLSILLQRIRKSVTIFALSKGLMVMYFLGCAEVLRRWADGAKLLPENCCS